MERSNSIAGLELENIVADLLDDASDIISLIDVVADPLGHFPVLWITAADNHLDEDLVRLRFRDGRVHDLHLGACTWWSVQCKSAAEGFFSSTFADYGLLHGRIVFLCSTIKRYILRICRTDDEKLHIARP